MWIVALIGIGIMSLVHTAPAPFALDAMAGDRSVWHMPRGATPTIYLTYDDGPNPSTTPDLLDVLAREAQMKHALAFRPVTGHDTELPVGGKQRCRASISAQRASRSLASRYSDWSGSSRRLPLSAR